jgi:hypothetical protein
LHGAAHSTFCSNTSRLFRPFDLLPESFTLFDVNCPTK